MFICTRIGCICNSTNFLDSEVDSNVEVVVAAVAAAAAAIGDALVDDPDWIRTELVKSETRCYRRQITFVPIKFHDCDRFVHSLMQNSLRSV